MSKYSRMNALMYAGAFWDKVCHDGRVATSVGYPKFSAGTPIDDLWTMDTFRGKEEDCTHFISCCIGDTAGKISTGGSTFTIKGGGLKVPCPFAGFGVYGHTYVTNIYYFVKSRGAKIIGDEFRNVGDEETVDDITMSLGPADLLIYSKGKHIRYHAHCAMLVSSTFITCHTRERFGNDYRDVKLPFVTLIKMPD